VFVLNEGHLRRRLRAYLRYYHGSRTHLALEKDAPEPRAVDPPAHGRIVALLSSVVSTTATSAARRSRGRSSSRSPGENAGARFGTHARDLDTGPASRCPLHAWARRTSGGAGRVFVLDQPSARILSNDTDLFGFTVTPSVEHHVSAKT